MSDAKPDLDLIDTDDLVDALRLRFQNFMLITERDIEGNSYEWRRHRKGRLTHLLGMCHQTTRDLEHDLDEYEKETGVEDDDGE